MNFLVDTHLILWAASSPEKLPTAARQRLDDLENGLWFSPASLWEIVIKRRLGRPDFVVDPRRLRRGLIDNGWRELPISSEHAVAVDDLPPLHKDPFDRMLLAQARLEGLQLLTSDSALARYPGEITTV